MKDSIRKLTSVLCLSLLFLLTACGNSKPASAMSVENDAFTLTPQEYIDYLNKFVEEQRDSRYLTVPDFTESGKEIDVSKWYLTLKLIENDEGKLTEIQWDWDSTRNGTTFNAAAYFGTTLYMISADADTADAVISELSMLDSAPPRYETSYVSNDVLYSYSTFGHAQYNTITISPDTES